VVPPAPANDKEELNPVPNMMSQSRGVISEVTTRDLALTYRVISRSQIE